MLDWANLKFGLGWAGRDLVGLDWGYWLRCWLADWLADWPTDNWLTFQMVGWLTKWRTDGLTVWLTGWLTGGLVTDWLPQALIDGRTDGHPHARNRAKKTNAKIKIPPINLGGCHGINKKRPHAKNVCAPKPKNVSLFKWKVDVFMLNGGLYYIMF